MVSKSRRIIALLPRDLNITSLNVEADNILLSQLTSGRKPSRIAPPFSEGFICVCFGMFPTHNYTPQTFFLESLSNLAASEYKVNWITTFLGPILSY